MSDRGLLSDVADAVAAQQEVDWNRCAQRALPGERNALDHLRAFAGICRAAGQRAGSFAVPAGRDSQGSRLVRRAVGMLVGVALLQSVVGLATGVTLLPAATAGMLAALAGPLAPDFTAVSPTGFLPVSDMTPAASFFRIVPHVLYPACGLLLFVGGRFDRRARLLGAVLVLLGAFWAQPVTRGFGVGLYPELFLPALLWMFVREFPRVRRRTRLDDAAARLAGFAAVVGGVLQVANLPPVQSLSPSLAVLARDVPGAYVAPAFFGPYCVLVLAALAVLLLRARGVAAEERPRTRLFVAGIVAALAPHVEGVVEVAFPGTVTPAAANWVSVLGSVSALAVPCLTMYAAIALRVLDVRTTVRVSARRLLTRGGLALIAIGPLAALGGLLESRAYWSVGEALADPRVQVCLTCVAAALAALAFRERLLARLDAWIAPETADQRLALALAGAELGQATGVAEAAVVVGRTAQRGAGVTGALLLADEASGARGHHFVAADAPLAPLPRTSTLAHVLEEVRLPLLVHPDARSSVFDLLPPADAAWVLATGTAAVVRVAGPGAQTAGLLAVGRPTDGGRLRPVDLAFLDALASTAGLALARLRLQDGPAGRTEPPPARACRDCGRLAAASDAGVRCDACGGAWAAAPVPALLAGKFLLERRIGAGGMGTVFRARDIGLDRQVAVKTLDGVSAERLGPVNTIGRFVISLLDGAHRDAVRTHRALPPATAWQCQHAQFAGAQRDPVRRRAGVQVARVAEALWELAHDLHPYESLVQERGARPGLRTPATRPVDPYQAGGGVAGQHRRQGPSRRHGGSKKNGPQAIGKSRGGWTTKIHLVAADARTALTFALSPGQAHDSPEGRKLLASMGPQDANVALVMDRAYQGDETRQLALDLGFTPVVPPLKTRTDPWEYDREMYKRRNEVERLFRRLKGYRRIFSRFEKLDVMFIGFIHFVLIFDALR